MRERKREKREREREGQKLKVMHHSEDKLSDFLKQKKMLAVEKKLESKGWSETFNSSLLRENS